MAKRKNQPRYGLMQSRARPGARDFLDFDYLKQLSDEELDWLNRFATEFYRADFSKPGKALHRTKAKKRECYGANNARNRDIWNQWSRLHLPDLANEQDDADDE